MTLSLRAFLQFVHCLRGDTHARLSFATADVDEAALVAEMEATPARLANTVYAMYQVIARTWLGDHEHAARLVLASDFAIEMGNTALVRLTEYGFFACLALCEARRMPHLDQRAVRRLLGEKRRFSGALRRERPGELSARAPARFGGARGGARTSQSVRTRLYDEAIRDAAANGFQQHAALASELAGRAYARRGLPEVARAYRRAARDGYAKWGAFGKVRAMDEDHPDGVQGARCDAPAARCSERDPRLTGALERDLIWTSSWRASCASSFRPRVPSADHCWSRLTDGWSSRRISGRNTTCR